MASAPRSDGFESRPIRVLYSFPHRIGAGRICETAWQQAVGVARAGAKVQLAPASVARPLPAGIGTRPTLARGRARIPYRVIGSGRAFALHDRIVARRLQSLAGRIDVVHTWPLGARETLRTAASLGIPTVLERPNTHTRYAYTAVQRECERLGVELPPDQEHAYNESVLRKEEEEYELAFRLACPSDFVAKTFLEENFGPERLVRHFYGFDESRFHNAPNGRDESQPFTMLFVGVAAVRKGLHFALEAWLRSGAREGGRFRIAGEILPAYREKLEEMLAHPSVEVLGHRNDVPELMRSADALVLPSIEEGSALVSSEALGSGCVPLVSEVSSGVCTHMHDSLVHPVGDVETLASHISMLIRDRVLLGQLRARAIERAREVTWTRAGERLLRVYTQVVEEHAAASNPPPRALVVSA